MSVRVTIEAATKAEAQLIADQLPIAADARSWRGFGVIRVDAKSKDETHKLIEVVSAVFQAHSIKWARVRYGDEERVFKANGRKAG